MYSLSWIIVGLMAGWLTGKLFEEGPIVAIITGIVGAIGVGFVMRFAGSPDHRGLIYTILAALLGAQILTAINALLTARMRHA
jgi:uncharacterized membrane protein YeaQ/YmgE (transglycosylase-associated protein family)